MIRTYRHPEQSRGIPSRYLKGFRTGSLESEPDWRFALDDISLKEAGGPDVFPLSPSGPRRILLHQRDLLASSDLVLHWLQPGVQFLQSKLETRLHRSQRVFGAGCDLAMTHSPKKR